MKERTLAIVEAYFSCNVTDCTSQVLAAYNNFTDYRTDTFNPYTYCSIEKYSTNCAQVLLQARPPIYGSAENIMITLLTCAKMKADTQKVIQVRQRLIDHSSFVLITICLASSETKLVTTSLYYKPE